MRRDAGWRMAWLLCAVCVAFCMPAEAGTPVHAFAGLPFGMPREALDGWLAANMAPGYTYLVGWKAEDYERIEVEGTFQYQGRQCWLLMVEVDSAQRLTNLDFRIVDASYFGEGGFDMEGLMRAYDGYFALAEELAAAYGPPDGGLLRYGDSEDRPYPADPQALRALAGEDTPYMTVLRFGNVLLTCHKSGLGAAHGDVTLGTTLFFFGPSKVEFAKALFPLYPL